VADKQYARSQHSGYVILFAALWHLVKSFVKASVVPFTGIYRMFLHVGQSAYKSAPVLKAEKKTVNIGDLHISRPMTLGNCIVSYFHQQIGMQSLVRYGADVTLLSTVAT